MSETPKRYWMSLVERDSPEEVNGDPDFVTSRRSFLKAAGYSFAGVVASSCSRAPGSTALPHVAQSEGLVPGRPVLYASTCGGCEAGCGVLVTTRDGRPLKIEGNPEHPLSGGATCAVGQASLLGLYDGERLGNPTRAGQRSTWEDVDKAIIETLGRIRQEGGAVRILTPTITSPTTAAVIAAFVGGFKNARHVAYDAISASAILDAHALTHGARQLPRYRFDRADVIVSFDADFLGTWISPVEFTRGYTSRRRIVEGGPQAQGDRARAHHVQIESRMSLTGSNADRRLPIGPGEIGHLATHLAVRLARRAGLPFAADGLAASPSEPALDAIADRLWAARGRGLVISGSQDVRVQLLINFINQTIGSYGTTVDLERPSYQRAGSDQALADLRAELSRGDVQALIVAGVNPVYDLPDAAMLAGDLRRVPLLVSTAERVDETASLAHFVCPDHHYLEKWDDAEPVSGVVSLTQPAIQPLKDTRALIESLSAWGIEPPQPALELVRAHWERAVYPRAGVSEPFQAFWNTTLERGAAEIAPRPAATKAFSVGPVRAIVRPDNAWLVSGVPINTLQLVLYPQVGMLDGRHGHNAWLHELPDPVTKVTWDNYACVSPNAARRLGIEDGDVVRVAAAGGTPALELPAFVQPGQHDWSLAIALGYGRAGTERFARVGPPWVEARADAGVVGVNASALISAVDGARENSGRAVTVVKTGRRHELASTQSHHSLAVAQDLSPALRNVLSGNSLPVAQDFSPAPGRTRPIVQEVTLAALTGSTAEPLPHQGEGDLWPPDHQYRGHRWGMAVDLDSCTGCSACVIACQSENNVPVVGQDEVRRKREMHWIRIDRYYSGADDNPEVAHQPMMCQHCEQAPCETVCPVLATTHSDEGLNEQVYNRCVGTRYCANNCPYKVRRFNWFDYPHEDRLQNLVFNPNVTVRSRGVMEKCTFCVQRIEETKVEMRRLGQPVADGAIKTACEQVCPAQAIVFGDLNDPKSRVARLGESRRAYRVLEDLNTKPAVRYLKLVRQV